MSWYVSDITMVLPYLHLKNIFVLNTGLREDIWCLLLAKVSCDAYFCIH